LHAGPVDILNAFTFELMVLGLIAAIMFVLQTIRVGSLLEKVGGNEQIFEGVHYYVFFIMIGYLLLMTMSAIYSNIMYPRLWRVKDALAYKSLQVRNKNVPTGCLKCCTTMDSYARIRWYSINTIEEKLQLNADSIQPTFPFNEYVTLCMNSYYSTISSASWKIWIIVLLFGFFDFWLVSFASILLPIGVRTVVLFIQAIIRLKLNFIQRGLNRIADDLIQNRESAAQNDVEELPLIQTNNNAYYSLFWFKRPNLLASIGQILAWSNIISVINLLLIYEVNPYTIMLIVGNTLSTIFLLSEMSANAAMYISVGPNTSMHFVKVLMKQKKQMLEEQIQDNSKTDIQGELLEPIQ